MDKLKNAKKLSTPELIELAYKLEDEEDYWECIMVLHGRGTILEFQTAEALCESEDPVRREIGADILGQLGRREEQQMPFQNESVAILIKLLGDPVDDVVASAAFSLGHRYDPAAIAELIKLDQHPNSEVRYGVASGLLGHEDPRAIDVLIRLSNDNDEDTRSWATFGLGNQIETDSPEIREALKARLSDEDPEIRGEALVGLARRKHPNTLDYVINELNSECIDIKVLEAAEKLGKQELYSLLKKLKNNEYKKEDDSFNRQLEQAIVACSPDTLP